MTPITGALFNANEAASAGIEGEVGWGAGTRPLKAGE